MGWITVTSSPRAQMNAVRTRVSATLDLLEMASIAIIVIQVRFVDD